MIDCEIVLTVYDQPQLTKECLDSLAACWRSCDRLTIVDNASAAETAKLLADWAKAHLAVDCRVIRLDPNQGFLKAANSGMKAGLEAVSPKQSLCLLSNDTRVTPGWLERMSGLLEREPSLGVVNPMSSTFGLRPASGQNIEQLAAALAATQAGQFTEAASCVGFCMLIRRRVLERIGFLDPVFADGYFEDTDFCRRAGAGGFGCAICGDAYVWHKEHATFKDSRRQELFERNRRIFEERWGKPQRQLVLVHAGQPEHAAVSSWCLASARKGNWLWVIVSLSQRERFSVLRRHGNIKVLETALPVWLAGWWLRLKRRKKPLTRVISSKDIANEKTEL